MPRGRRYHDPFVQAPEPVTESQPIPGLLVEKGGVYLHVDDVAAALRRMASELTDQSITPQETLLAAAASFGAVFEAT